MLGTMETVKEALVKHSDEVAEALVPVLAMLGAHAEWSMEHNFTATETVAKLSRTIGLPDAFDQERAELSFWREVADEVGVYYYHEDANEDEG
jgi:hypothetical protein